MRVRMCEQVSVGVVIEANSLQLRVITQLAISVPVTLSLLSDPCSLRSTFTRRFWFLVSAIPEPCCFPGPDRRRLVCPLLPCATRLSPTESSVSAYGKLRFCLRKAPRLPTEAPPLCLRKAPFSFSLRITSCNKLSFSATESSRLHCDTFS